MRAQERIFTENLAQPYILVSFEPHLINVYVVIVGSVIDGFEKAMQLAGGPSMDHQHKGYSHWFGWKALN